jgi:hypothetical protein
LTNPSYQTITVGYTTTGDTASAGSDYVSVTSVATFEPGDTEATFVVEVIGDKTVEADEQFLIEISDAVNAGLLAMPGYGGIVNDDTAPVAQNDSAVTTVDVAATITVLANDSDQDGDTLTVAAAGPAGHGSVVINPDNTVTYTPNTGFEGTDSFSYTVSDGYGQTGSATVTVTVGQPQLLEGEVGTDASRLTFGELQPVIVAAIAVLDRSGFDVGRLSHATFVIDDLQGGILGVTHQSTIWIDQNAAGHGWYVGPGTVFSDQMAAGEWAMTPGEHSDRIDLLTLVMHELGHVLGFDSVAATVKDHDWMTATLGAGVRRLPTGVGILDRRQLPGAAVQSRVELGGLLPVEPLRFVPPSESPIDYALPAESTQRVPEPPWPYIVDLAAFEARPPALSRFELAKANATGGEEDVLVGGAGDDLLIGDAGEMYLVGGFGWRQ